MPTGRDRTPSFPFIIMPKHRGGVVAHRRPSRCPNRAPLGQLGERSARSTPTPSPTLRHFNMTTPSAYFLISPDGRDPNITECHNAPTMLGTIPTFLHNNLDQVLNSTASLCWGYVELRTYGNHCRRRKSGRPILRLTGASLAEIDQEYDT